MSMQRIRACLYADPGNTGMSRAVVCSCVYIETGTSRLTETPVEETPLSSGTNFVHINAISRYTGMKWNEIQNDVWQAKTSNKRKQKETTFVGMLFMETKLVFALLTNYYQLFHAFLNEMDTSRSPAGNSGVPRSYKPGIKYVSGNRDIPVYRDHINRA